MSEQPNEVQQAAGESVRTAITAAMQAAELRAAIRSQRALEAQSRSDRERAQAAERLKAERDAAMPIMRRPWDQRWWRDAGVEDIGQAWQVCAEWAAADDPYAKASLKELQRQVERRYGVTLPAEPTAVDELAMLLAAPSADVGPEPEFGELEAEPGPRFRYSVRSADGAELAAGELAAATAQDAALEVLGRYARSSPDPGEDRNAQIDRLLAHGFGEPMPGPDTTGVVVEVFDADGNQVYSMAAEQAEQVRADLRERRQKIISAGPGIHDGDRLEAVAAEIRAGRMEAAELRRRLDRAYRDTSVGVGSEDEVAAIAADLRAVNGRLNDLALRRRMLEASARGEDAAAIRQAAVLRQSLDEDWWRTASVGEVAGVVDEVASWGPGAGRDEAQRWLRGEIHATYDVDIADLSDAGEVAAQLANVVGEANPDGPELAARPPQAREDPEVRRQATNAAQDMRAAEAMAGVEDREAAEAVTVAAQGFTGTPTDRLNATTGRRTTQRRRPTRGPKRDTERGR